MMWILLRQDNNDKIFCSPTSLLSMTIIMTVHRQTSSNTLASEKVTCCNGVKRWPHRYAPADQRILAMQTLSTGGTFALYSLICRYTKVSLIPNQQPEDRKLSNYRLDTPSNQLSRSIKIKEKLETSKAAQIMLFLITILGTSMVIGDGVLTPCISGVLFYSLSSSPFHWYNIFYQS